MNLTRQKRLEYWNHFIEQFFIEKIGGGHIVTAPRLRRIKEAVLNDNRFWFDIIDRHNGQGRSPERIRAYDIENYDHCLCNFWGMVIEMISKV